MSDTKTSDLDSRIETRLNILRNALQDPDVCDLPIGSIAFLGKLLASERLRDLEFDRSVDPTSSSSVAGGPVPSMEIDISQRRRVYRISHRTREAMQRVIANRELNDQAADWMVDNYFIHELLHLAQGMAGGNHSGLSRQAPQVLLAIDYQADALAAVTATVLAWCFPEQFGFATVTNNVNHWTLYEHAIEAILNQLEIFTLLRRKDMDRTKISQMRGSLERTQRIAIWHYQLHRVRHFLPDRPLADFQILAQPVLDFRNLAWAASFAPDALRRDWPAREREHAELERYNTSTTHQRRQPFGINDRAPLIVTGVTPNGTTQFVRHAAATPQQYAMAFEGIFDNHDRASRDFFTTLFASEEWLIGGGGKTPHSLAWSVVPRHAVSKLTKLTRGLAKEDKRAERLDLLNQIMTPSRFPQVLMMG